MGAAPVSLEMAGCEAGGATFAVMLARLDDASAAGAALAGWKQATLANMRASAVSEAPFQPSGSLPLRESLRVTASGQRADGTPLQFDAAWFLRRQGEQTLALHAVVLSNQRNSTAVDNFFSSIQLK